jgi:hypothetical protein
MFGQVFKNVDDVLRREAGCTNELNHKFTSLKHFGAPVENFDKMLWRRKNESSRLLAVRLEVLPQTWLARPSL